VSFKAFKLPHRPSQKHLIDANGENGLLLTPSIDHLFDRGFIGFEDNGKLIISPVAHRPSLQRMGIDTAKVVNVGGSPAAKSTSWISIGMLSYFSLSEPNASSRL
jgi:hypothetical protein